MGGKIYGAYAALSFVIVILLVFCPILIACPTLAARRFIGRAAVRAWLASCFVPFRVRGLEHLPKGTCVAICNHASYVDGILLTAALPGRFTFLVQHAAADWPYVGLIIRRMGVSFVNRGSPLLAAKALSELVVRAGRGESMMIFPEGTFDQQPALKAFYEGAFLIAAQNGLPILPAVIIGSRRFFGDGKKLPSWSAITIQFLPQVEPRGADRVAIRVLRDSVRAIVAAHCGEADALLSIDQTTQPLESAHASNDTIVGRFTS